MKTNNGQNSHGDDRMLSTAVKLSTKRIITSHFISQNTNDVEIQCWLETDTKLWRG